MHSPSLVRISRRLAALATCLSLVPLCAFAQLSYSTAGATVTQNFNGGLPASASNSLTWTNNSTANFTGWHIYRELNGTPATYRRNATSSSGQVQHFRASDSATDGALGGRPNDTTGKIHYGLRLRNNTGSTLRSFTLSYALEQWHRSGASTPNDMVVSFRVGNPASLADDGMWAIVHHLTLSAPHLGGTAGDLDGSAAANRVTSPSVTVGGFAWAPNTDLWLRFSDENDGGVDQGLAIDDLSFSASTTATVPVGSPFFGRNGYIEYQRGDCPIIIVAGHGGVEQPAELADRTNTGAWPDSVLIPDQNTEDLARRIVNEIHARSGQRPHLVVNRLHRGKLDPNREIGEAAQGDPNTEISYNEFHAFIEDARLAIEPAFGFGLLVDIHGHAHDIDRLEFGYNLGATDLNKSDAELERPSYAENFSMRTHTYRPGVGLPALIRGPRSFGDLLDRRGYPGVPSPNVPGPGSDPYFAGGYNIEEHGSLKNVGNIQSFQIEAWRVGVRDTADNRTAFAKALATSINDFVYDQFGYELGSGGIFKLTTSSDRVYENGGAITLTVTRSGYRPITESMALTYSGTAVRGTDYTAATSVSFSSSDTVKTITLTPLNDALAEGAETIIVALAPTALQTADVLPLTIALSDDDRASVHVVALQSEAIEGGSTANVQVTRDVVSGTLTATLAFGGTAVRGLDYTVTGVDGMDRVSFGTGVASVNVGIVPLNDSLMEPAKSVEVSVVAGASYSTGVPGTATVTIRDNDHDAALQLWLANRIGNGAWRDESSHGRDGALRPTGSDAPVTSVGVAGTALEFDGQNDAVVVPYFTVSPTAFSLTFRFRLDATATSTAFRHLFNLGTYDAPDSLTIFRVESNDRIRTLIRDSAGNPALGTSLDVSNMTTGSTWRHYALTASTSGGLKVYIDGVLAKSVSTWSGNWNPASALWFGWRGEYNLIASRHLDGAMEDIRLYSRALSASEVAEIAAVPTTATFTSVVAHDGWVLESSETSNVGGSNSATASTTSALRAGDDSSRRQYKSILSFDTSTLPASAVIVSATLKLKRGTVAGTNPFTTHGECRVDIKGGSGFGGSTALANGDFEAAADATAVAVLSNAASNGDWSIGALSPTGLSHINKSGYTQFRVYFAADDNNNSTADYVGWYSGDHGTSANRPVLEIVYR